MTTELSKTITDLEASAALAETENHSLKTTNALQAQQITALEKQLKDALADRDYYLAQNAQLHALLDGAGAFIVEGIRKINLNDARAKAIQT